MLEKDNELAVLDISNQVLARAGYSERFSEEDNRKYYGLKWFQYFERLLPGLTLEEHMALQAACFKFAEENLPILAKHIKPNDYVLEVLEAIKSAGHDQVVVSNTRQSDLEWFIQAIGIDAYFRSDKVFGVNAHQKHGVKQAALASYAKGKNFDGIVIIGDSQSDMDLKEAAGGTTYFYNHPHIESSKVTGADHKIKDLREVLNEL